MASNRNELEEMRRKMLSILEEQKPKPTNWGAISGYTCAQISPTYQGQIYSCASYNPNNSKIPSDEELYYRSVGTENQKLLGEMQHMKARYETLVYQNRVLIERVRQLESENNAFKAKKNKKKDFDVAINNFFTKIKVGIVESYQSVVNWFNT